MGEGEGMEGRVGVEGEGKGKGKDVLRAREREERERERAREGEWPSVDGGAYSGERVTVTSIYKVYEMYIDISRRDGCDAPTSTRHTP
jgi:hypothetical protein